MFLAFFLAILEGGGIQVTYPFEKPRSGRVNPTWPGGHSELADTTMEKKQIPFKNENYEKIKKSVSSKLNLKETDFLRISIFPILKMICFF